MGLYRREGECRGVRGDACEHLNTCDMVSGEWNWIGRVWRNVALELNGAHREKGGGEALGDGWANEEEGSVLGLAAKEGHVGWVGVHGLSCLEALEVPEKGHLDEWRFEWEG